MSTLTPQLPTILGSFAAMLVAFISLMSGTSPGTCFMKAVAAFLVFAGFGLILRFALLDAAADKERNSADPEHNPFGLSSGGLDLVSPGMTVADLLAQTESSNAYSASHTDDQQAA